MMKNWQDERDKRTDSCLNVNGQFKAKSVHVVVTIKDRRDIQLMTMLTLNMLVRWCRKVLLTIEDQRDLISGTESFVVVLQSTVATIDPECEFSVNPTVAVSDVTLFIKPRLTGYTGNFVCIGADRWVSACSFNEDIFNEIPPSGNFLSSGFSACLGNAEVFRFVNGIQARPYVKWYSLWENDSYNFCPGAQAFGQELQPNLKIGRIHLVGCGAIGSSFVFLFPFSGFSAEFLLVDPDFVKDPNTSSSLLFCFHDSQKQLAKVDICHSYLLKSGLEAKRHKDDYSTHQYKFDNTIDGADVILCFANENNIWSTIQNLYPPLTFHATTSKSWGINIGRHVPLIEGCLMCTFKDIVQTQFVPKCSEAEVSGGEENEESHTAILPFLAPAAALVTMSELVKSLSTRVSRDNTTIFNMGSNEGTFITDYQSFGSCYICSGQMKLYQKFGPSSMHWTLSSAIEVKG